MLYLQLNENLSSIANKYREGKLQSTLRRKLNAFEMIATQPSETRMLQGLGTEVGGLDEEETSYSWSLDVCKKLCEE